MARVGKVGLAVGRAATIAVALVVVALAIAVPAGSGASPAGPPALAPVVLPRDHASHPGFGIEWWYTTGRLTDTHGGRYFYFATVWSATSGVLARVNVVDLGDDRIVVDREYLNFNPLRERTTTIRAGGYVLSWQPQDRWGAWSLTAPAAGGLSSLPSPAPRPRGALNLRLVPEQPYVLNGARGIIRQGPARSAYYSAPRLAVSGTLVVQGRTVAVKGQGWFDHQWGNFPTDQSSLRWNWFACQLGDGRALMLYQFLAANDVPSGVQAGTLVMRDGRGRHLQRFTISPNGPFLRPPGAQATYPQAWTLSIPAAHLNLRLRSLANNQFIWMAFVPSFWEGAAAITRGAAGTCVIESTREPASGSL
jgi:predicted secreted hydrolase